MSNVLTEDLLPECGYITTLLPVYSNPLQYGDGTISYKQYVNAFANRVKSDFMCYDYYPYSMLYRDDSYYNHLAEMLENYEVFRDVCQKYDRDFYIILQSNDAEWNGKNYAELTEEHMKYQAYSAMAYGTKSITWACWITGWGIDNVLDDNGNKTDQYVELQSTNAHLKAVEPIYMRYTVTSTALQKGENAVVTPELLNYAVTRPVDKLDQSSIADLTVGDEDLVLIGAFRKNVGEGEAFLLVGSENILFDEEVVSTVTFKTADPASVVTAYVGDNAAILNPDENGVYTVEIHNADAVFVTVH